jgi:DNA (cytosine-5)-methyltransferase 1
MKNLKVNSFFAGIGGFDLGFERAGINPTFHCEINTFCRSVLRRHWPNVQCQPNILEVNHNVIPKAEIWCGGFPCQDVSVARGHLGRDGLKGKNTGLFYPFVGLVKEKLPPVVLMENVTGLLSSHSGRDFSVILHEFQKIGYGVAWRILNTRYFGAPQSRPRVYICAWRGSMTSALKILYDEGESHLPENPRLGFIRKSESSLTGAHVPEVAFCLAATSGRHTGTDWSRTYIAYDDEVRRLTPTECERLQGFPENWTIPNDDFHLSGDEIDTLRYHAIGNAVSVPVVEWVAARIRSEFESFKKNKFIEEDLPSALEFAKKHALEFSSSKAKVIQLDKFDGHDNAPTIKWSSGGIMLKGTCLVSKVSPAPHRPSKSKLIDALDKKKPSDRYFLSSNAATGILRRVESQNRHLFEPLDKALRLLAKKM